MMIDEKKSLKRKDEGEQAGGQTREKNTPRKIGESNTM